MSERYVLRSLPGEARFSDEQFVNLNLFDGQAFFGRLLLFRRGQQVPVHVHAHKDECFDVLSGEGTLLVGDRQVRAGPGIFLYVPAGVLHGLRADLGDRWVVRETVGERVYLRRALRLLWQAFWKRLPGRKGDSSWD